MVAAEARLVVGEWEEEADMISAGVVAEMAEVEEDARAAVGEGVVRSEGW